MACKCHSVSCTYGKCWLVTDFGFPSLISVTASTGLSSGMCGTTGFHAPELVVVELDDEGNTKPSKFSQKTDVWSLGCILYELVTKQIIFLKDLQTRFFAMGVEGEGLLDERDDDSHPLLLKETFCPIEQRKITFL